jgi:hypothetical protein
MRGPSRDRIRRLAGLLVGMTLLALGATPAALADTITPEQAVEFSGVVDSSPSCTTQDATATINWGDGTPASAASINPATHTVSGTHTYATLGDYSGEVDFTNDACSDDVDPFTAHVTASPPMFTQCPPVDFDTGCQFLIVVSNGGTTIETDPNQPPYDDSDDALVGIVNDGTGPITSVPLSSSVNDIFGFDGDGICDAGELPIAPGCVPQAGAPAGETCGLQTDGSCSFPAPPGEPAGYVEPGAENSYRQNGYEGPTTWYSNISADQMSGTVNFSPALEPGQTTYFGLEGALTAAQISPGGSPQGGTFVAPPTVTTTGATFSALVDPNGSATTAYFQYGIVAADRGPGSSTATYDESTPVQNVGGDFANHTVTASVSGLVPNATYNVQLVATNSGGTTFGPNQTFTTGKTAPPPPPVLGKTVNASPISGVVFIEPPSGKTLGTAGDAGQTPDLSKGQGFVPLTEARQIPTGSEIDAMHGSLKIVTATGHVGKTQNATLTGGVFKVTQARTGITKGLTDLTLVEAAFAGAPTYASCKAKSKKSGDEATIASLSSRTLQLLRASAHGKFRTTGRYSSATVRGTVWGISDRCDGTLTRAIRDTVLVQDFVRHVTIVLHAGQSYLAKKP